MGLRILMASDFYSPFIGGAERQIELLSHELVLRGHTVSLATVWHMGLPERQDDSGVSIHRLKGLSTRVPWFSKDPARRFHPPFPDPSIAWELKQLIKQFQPNLIHAQGWIAYSCVMALSGARIPLLITARDTGYSCATRSLMHHGKICTGSSPMKCVECAAESYGLAKSLAAVVGIFSGRVLFKSKIAAYHSVSTFVDGVIKRDLLNNRDEPPKIGASVIADIAIPTAQNETARISETTFLDCLPTEPYILYVGALQTNKGIKVLLTAYERLTSPPPLVLIGTVWHDTPQTFPSGAVVFHSLPHECVMVAFECCLFGVVPSILPDALPGVVREAMSKGKAVIGTAVGGIVDMITDGETGLLIPPGDVDALMEAMRRLIDDAEMRERLGRAGQEDVKRFGADSVVPRFEKLYRELIDEAREGHQ